MSGELSLVLDHNVLVCNNAIELGTGAYVGILEEHAVFDYRSASHVNASEDNGILNGSLDNATLCNYRVRNLRAFAVACGCGVSDLGKHGAVLVACSLISASRSFIEQSK